MIQKIHGALRGLVPLLHYPALRAPGTSHFKA